MPSSPRQPLSAPTQVSTRARATTEVRGDLRLDTPLQFLPGVGPKLAQEFARRGLATIEDLLYYLPFRYEDRSHLRPIAALEPGETATVLAEVRAVRFVRTRQGVSLLRLAAADGTGTLDCLWFHADYLKDRFHPGQRLALYGRVEMEGGKREFRQPEFAVLEGAGIDSLKLGRIVPIYQAIGPLTSGRLRWLVSRALERLPRQLPEALPEPIRAQFDLPERRQAFDQVHFPADDTSLPLLAAARTPGHLRLILEELFFLQYGIELKRRRALQQTAPRLEVTTAVRERLKEMLAFHPTADQKRALKEIADDMASGHPMRRLLEGDVGCGKTIVSLQAAVIAMENGYQVALMAPTQILAAQHYYSARERLGAAAAAALGEPAARYRIQLVTAATRGKRGRQQKALASGAPQLVIGTQALLEGQFQFSRLGLIIVDEQHRFGVMQRFDLMRKAELTAHVLVMTATPIPRTLALALYGDLNASVIREMPPGRPPVITRCVPPEKQAAMLEFVRGHLEQGRQAFFVYPAIDENPRLDLKPALRMHAQLREVYTEFNVGLLHGRMKEAEKDAIMRAFQHNRIQVLVATSVIEVGLDVPNASIMVIEDAERFGLAQLHQMRGRVGRPRARARGGKAYCFLVPGEELTEMAKRRLEALTSAQDGFALAELDLKLRGPGEFFGTKQSGLPELEVADPLRDQELMSAARAAARQFLDSAPREEQRTLVQHIQQRWQRKYGLIEVG